MGEVIDETGKHIGTIYKGLELTDEDDTPEMKNLIDKVKKKSPKVVDVVPTEPTPILPRLPDKTSNNGS